MSNPTKRPNLILFNPDQWRGDVVGYAGNPAAVTPNLDRFVAEDGVGFTRAYCQNTVCTPSRCSFMSGWYPHVRGHRTMYHMMKPDEPVLLRRLKQEGYHVWWGGKNDLVPAQVEDIWDEYCDRRYWPKHYDREAHQALETRARGRVDSDTYYSFHFGRVDPPGGGEDRDADWDLAREAARVIREGLPEPWCLFIAHGTPHPPYRVEDPWYSMIDRDKLPPRPLPPEGPGEPSIHAGIRRLQNMQSWTQERWADLRATYYGMCARTDHFFGEVLEAVRDADQWDDTAVFLFSDHGDFTGDYGLVEKTQNTFQDCLSRVPFAVKPPAWIETKPRATDALVELVDLPATIEAMAGIEPRHTHFGRSLLPILAGDDSAGRDAVFCEGGRLKGERQAMELESKSSQEPAGLYWPRMEMQRTSHEAHGKAAMCRTDRHKYVRRLYEADELYDLEADPQERDNRIDDPDLADVRRWLEDRLLTWYQETADVVPPEPDKR